MPDIAWLMTAPLVVSVAAGIAVAYAATRLTACFARRMGGKPCSA